MLPPCDVSHDICESERARDGRKYSEDMSEQGRASSRIDAAIVWTSVGVITSFATLALMLGVAMVSLGASDPDPTEGVYGYGLGAIGLGVWVGLVIASGRMLRKSTSRGLHAILPTLVSAVWCGFAVAALSTALDITNTLFSLVSSWVAPMWMLLVISVTTAGTIPIAFALLITNVVLRVVRARRTAAPRLTLHVGQPDVSRET